MPRVRLSRETLSRTLFPRAVLPGLRLATVSTHLAKQPSLSLCMVSSLHFWRKSSTLALLNILTSRQLEPRPRRLRPVSGVSGGLRRVQKCVYPSCPPLSDMGGKPVSNNTDPLLNPAWQKMLGVLPGPSLYQDNPWWCVPGGNCLLSPGSPAAPPGRSQPGRPASQPGRTGKSDTCVRGLARTGSRRLAVVPRHIR